MKKIKLLIPAVCLSLILALTACTTAPVDSSEPIVDNGASVSSTVEDEGPENVTVTEAQGPATAAQASEWTLLTEAEFKVAPNIVGYYDASTAVSGGYAGEIHYINAQETDWPKAENTSMCRFGLDIVNGTTVFTCGNEGQVTKSTDGGKTFTRVGDFGGSEPNQCSVMSFCDESNGIIAAPKRLAITADGAETWTEITVPFEILTVRMESPEKFYCIGKDFVFYKTTDGGATWEGTPMNLPLGDAYLNNIRTFALSIDGDNMYTVFCIESTGNTVKSYSTADGWFSCSENTVPEIAEMEKSVFYLNQDGTLLTITNKPGKKAIVLEKQ